MTDLALESARESRRKGRERQRSGGQRDAGRHLRGPHPPRPDGGGVVRIARGAPPRKTRRGPSADGGASTASAPTGPSGSSRRGRSGDDLRGHRLGAWRRAGGGAGVARGGAGDGWGGRRDCCEDPTVGPRFDATISSVAAVNSWLIVLGLAGASALQWCQGRAMVRRPGGRRWHVGREWSDDAGDRSADSARSLWNASPRSAFAGFSRGGDGGGSGTGGHHRAAGWRRGARARGDGQPRPRRALEAKAGCAGDRSQYLRTRRIPCVAAGGPQSLSNSPTLRAMAHQHKLGRATPARSRELLGGSRWHR